MSRAQVSTWLHAHGLSEETVAVLARVGGIGRHDVAHLLALAALQRMPVAGEVDQEPVVPGKAVAVDEVRNGLAEVLCP